MILRFGAVDYAARVWVNVSLAISHEGGHTPFWADITPLLTASRLQTVTVRAEDDPHDITKPRGKQDWQLEPHAIWYPRTSGIWQTVCWERVGRTYIDKIRWTPSCRDLRHRPRLARRRRPGRGPGGRGHPLARRTVAGARSLPGVNREADRIIVLSDPGIEDYRNELLWSPERSTLLEAQIRLMCGDRLVDEFRSYTGLRSVSTLRDRFMLNGRPYDCAWFSTRATGRKR